MTANRDHEIAAFVKSQLDLEPTRVARLDAFATNEVYEVDAGERRFVVKASPMADASRAEVFACRHGAAAECFAPVILSHARLDGGLSAFIMNRVPGSPIAPRDPSLRHVGTGLRRLHAVTLPGFGSLAEAKWDDNGGFSFARDTWLGFLRGICDDARGLADTYAIAAALADAVASTIDTHADDLAAVEIGSLCHGDLKTTHILVEGDRLAGVIDWGDTAIADPLWDIARFAHRADAGSLALLLDGYDPTSSLADALVWRIPLYGALWMMVDAVVDHRLGRRADVALDGLATHLALPGIVGADR